MKQLSSKEKTMLVLESITDQALGHAVDEEAVARHQLCGRWFTELRWQSNRTQEQLAADTNIDVKNIVLLEYGAANVDLTPGQLAALASLLANSKEMRPWVEEAIRCCAGQVEPREQLLAHVIVSVTPLRPELMGEEDVDALAGHIGQEFGEAFNTIHAVPRTADAQQDLRDLYPSRLAIELRRTVEQVLSAIYDAFKREDTVAKDVEEINTWIWNTDKEDVRFIVISNILSELKRDGSVENVPSRLDAFRITTKGIGLLAALTKEATRETTGKKDLRRRPSII